MKKKKIAAIFVLAITAGMITIFEGKNIVKADTQTSSSAVGVTYQGHVQNIGWQKSVSNGSEAGTNGKGLRVEALKLNLTNAPTGSHIKYQAHVENVGWQKSVTDGAEAGTDGKGLRVEALKIWLEDMPGYSVQYRAHVQNIGWQDWVSDGSEVGTTGQGLRVEAIEVRIVKTSDNTSVGVTYQGHVQNIGWQDSVENGQEAGTDGQGLRVEALKLKLTNVPAGAHIKYQTHVENIGWKAPVEDGAEAGTDGKGLRVEALKVALENMPGYSVQYRAHVQNIGWQNWVSDGAEAGTDGKGLRVEAVEVRIIKTADGSTPTPQPFSQENTESAYADGGDTGASKLSASISGISSIKEQYIRGVDLTSYQAEKSAGVNYYDFSGNKASDSQFMQLLKSSGINYINLKVAVNPTDSNGKSYGGGVPTLDNAIKTASLAKAAGLKVNINFLYSDFYTSKDTQKLPKGWASDLPSLTSQVKEYTQQSLKKLQTAGVTPDMVTVGSEINQKFLDKTDWDSITHLIGAATSTVRSFNSGIKIAVAFSGVTPSWTTTFADELKYNNVDYDILGVSVYPAYDSLNDIAKSRETVVNKYNKKFAVLSVLYPFTQYDSDGQSNGDSAQQIANKKIGEISPQGQAAYMRNLFKSVITSQNNVDAGVFYGDASWIAVHPGTDNWQTNKDAANTYGTGWVSQYAQGYVSGANYWGASNQDNEALFDDLGHPLASLKMFSQLLAANSSDKDLIPSSDDPYATGDDTGATKETASINSSPTVSNDTIRGVDVSSYQALYNAGVRFKGFDGKQASLFKILSDNGVNYVRLRLWVNPYDSNGNAYGGGNDDLPTVVKMAKEASQYNLKVLIDIHYSDFYPSPYRRPKAWKNDNFDQLKTDVYNYTKDVMQTMTSNSVNLGMVQIGNETNGGFLGYGVDTNDMKNPNWDKVMELMQQGSKAIRSYAPKGTKIAVHYTLPWPSSDSAIAQKLQDDNVDYDVFGTTYYPFWSVGSDYATKPLKAMDVLAETEKAITTKFHKEFAVMEYSYPFTTKDSDGHINTLNGPSEGKGYTYPYDISPQGQANVIHDVLDTVTSTSSLGIGAFYWEPAWIAVVPGTNHWQINQDMSNKYGTGWASKYSVDNDSSNTEYASWGASSWDNQALFDDKGSPLQSLKAFSQIVKK